MHSGIFCEGNLRMSLQDAKLAKGVRRGFEFSLVSQSTASNGRVRQTKAHEKFIRKIP